MSEYDGGDFPNVNPQSVLRTLSSEDLAQTNQHWFRLVEDILKKIPSATLTGIPFINTGQIDPVVDNIQRKWSRVYFSFWNKYFPCSHLPLDKCFLIGIQRPSMMTNSCYIRRFGYEGILITQYII